MKTAKNIYPQIIEFKNLYKAFKKASKGKLWKPYVEHFKVNLEKELFQLQEDLISKIYQPGEYSLQRKEKSKNEMSIQRKIMSQ